MPTLNANIMINIPVSFAENIDPELLLAASPEFFGVGIF